MLQEVYDFLPSDTQAEAIALFPVGQLKTRRGSAPASHAEDELECDRSSGQIRLVRLSSCLQKQTDFSQRSNRLPVFSHDRPPLPALNGQDGL